MESFFIVILIFLIVLAVFDLFVGVSNDAANFLNSAIGSRIAPFKVVMVVASLGVLIGATFSSGMMEIARSGVFNPEMFTFADLIAVFFAVVVTDVMLLNVFNSFGLPTSTTVSVVFSLLGGSVCAAAIKLWRGGHSFAEVGAYINNEKALGIISGIVISVVVAFTAGVIVQYLTRLMFTFRYERIYRRIGGLFGGLALTAIFYFLVIKGLKGASFVSKEHLAWINEHMALILLCTFAGLTVVFQGLILIFRFNIFRLIILAGTFALAFAFAGNDLVNFVGVPLAAAESYSHYKASGVPAHLFTLEVLKTPVQTSTVYLLISGIIMVITLWVSKKAQNVVKTSVRLSSSVRGEKEQFGSSVPGRMIVRSSLRFGKVLHHVFPERMFTMINRRMRKPKPKKGEVPLAFDHVRASVNLVVASILIASATSLKLPLSTTYVTFMVAMGSSLADGAWDRESAVYRISGVITVISGWFFTALMAFTSCALIVCIVNFGGTFAVIAIMLIVVTVIVYSNFISKSNSDSSADMMRQRKVDRNSIRESINLAVSSNLDASIRIFEEGLDAFFREDLSEIKAAKNNAVALFYEISRERGEYYHMALEAEGDHDARDARHFYYRAFTNMKEAGSALRGVLAMAEYHVANQHRVYKGVLRENLLSVVDILKNLQGAIKTVSEPDMASQAADPDLFSRLSNEGIMQLNKLQMELLHRIDLDRLSLRGSELYMNFLQFAREVISRYTINGVLQAELNESCRLANAQKAS